MIHQLNVYGKDKVQLAIDRMRTFEPPEGYYLCFSGGKDSVVLKAIADMAGVRYDAHYNVTSADPPEVIYFMRDNYPEVAFDYPHDKNGNRITMWNLIPKKKMPPTRLVRYCCNKLKEGGGRRSFCTHRRSLGGKCKTKKRSAFSRSACRKERRHGIYR